MLFWQREVVEVLVHLLHGVFGEKIMHLKKLYITFVPENKGNSEMNFHSRLTSYKTNTHKKGPQGRTWGAIEKGSDGPSTLGFN